MKTPSQYPVLDNRPIDQWKVTELKEELKRRKLTTRGLKEELVRRLDEALRSEMEAATKEDDHGVGDIEPENVAVAVVAEPTVNETAESGLENSEDNVGKADGNSSRVDDVSAQVDVELLNEEKSLEEQELGVVNDLPSEVNVLTATDVPVACMGDDVGESLSYENADGVEGLQDGKMERDDEDSRAQQQSEDIEPPHEDLKLDSCDPNNQVSEVSSSLGFPVKSNSISTDSVSLIEKNDLKDNIIADNVKLESVKPEMVQPSSSDLVPDGGKSHPSDVEEPHEIKVSVEDTDNNVTNADMSHKNYSADLGSSEKLNLDRSSGDDSMEEDALESKQIDSSYNSEEVGEKTEKNEVAALKDEGPVATMDTDLPATEKGFHYENDDVVAASSDKRKLPDQEAILSNEPSKRQRRWKSESNNIKEPQISNIPIQAARKDVPQSATLKRNLSGSDSAGTMDSPKEREVPPSTKPATNSLRIDRFLRPFTLKAVQELLAKTGTVTSFWMDHIKTHCFVTYSSVEEAVETRNAVYNLQWPPNGGRHLVAEFVDPQEVKLRLEPLPASAAPVTVTSGPTTAPEPPTLSQPSPRQQNLRQQMPQPPTLPPPPPLSNPVQARERALPPPPPQNEKVEPPIVTLDDLFRKTKATPRIYYLPLSEEQASAVLEAQRKNSKQ